MAAATSALAAATTGAGALSNLVLVTPNRNVGYQPLNPPNADGSASVAQLPPTIVFNYEGEQSITLDSDITDHFVEDNTAVADQIALKPLIIHTSGFVGELNDIIPSVLAPLQVVADKLVTVGAYVPGLSATALLAFNEAVFLYDTAANAASAAVSAWSSINGTGGSQTQQQKYYGQFVGYRASRTLFQVQTPWAIYTNCAIMSLRAIQDEKTNVITNFEISFKQISFASTQLAKTNNISGNVYNLQNRAANQALGADPVNLGIGTTGPTTPFSVTG